MRILKGILFLVSLPFLLAWTLCEEIVNFLYRAADAWDEMMGGRRP